MLVFSAGINQMLVRISNETDPDQTASSSESAPGGIAQSVTCLTADMCPTADPGFASLIPARLHTYFEIDHQMIILLPSGCCQLQVKVCA